VARGEEVSVYPEETLEDIMTQMRQRREALERTTLSAREALAAATPLPEEKMTLEDISELAAAANAKRALTRAGLEHLWQKEWDIDIPQPPIATKKSQKKVTMMPQKKAAMMPQKKAAMMPQKKVATKKVKGSEVPRKVVQMVTRDPFGSTEAPLSQTLRDAGYYM
jgi:hypothetical protein